MQTNMTAVSNSGIELAELSLPAPHDDDAPFPAETSEALLIEPVEASKAKSTRFFWEMVTCMLLLLASESSRGCTSACALMLMCPRLDRDRATRLCLASWRQQDVPQCMRSSLQSGPPASFDRLRLVVRAPRRTLRAADISGNRNYGKHSLLPRGLPAMPVGSSPWPPAGTLPCGDARL